MSEKKTKDPAKMTESELKIHDLERDVESLIVQLKREKSVNDILDIIPKLYYKYKKKSDEKIIEFLKDKKIVKAQHKGIGTEFGYYPLSDEAMKKILSNPRGNSLIFDATETSEESIKGLKVYKEFYYLVKSTSRFFLKPDIGEIIDQIDLQDYYSKEIKAIVFDPDHYQTLDGTDGEHFLMKAKLLVDNTF